MLADLSFPIFAPSVTTDGAVVTDGAEGYLSSRGANRSLYTAMDQATDYQASQIIIFVFSIFNSLCSGITLYLIYHMQLKINIYLKVVIFMTIMQLIFDLNLTLYEVEGSSRIVALQIQLVIGAFSGAAGALLSNLLGTVIAFIVYTKKSFKSGIILNISIGVIMILCLVEALLMSPLVPLSTNLIAFLVYNYFRVASIIYNIISTIYIYYDIYRINKKSTMKSNDHPLLILANRMVTIFNTYFNQN